LEGSGKQSLKVRKSEKYFLMTSIPKNIDIYPTSALPSKKWYHQKKKNALDYTFWQFNIIKCFTFLILKLKTFSGFFVELKKTKNLLRLPDLYLYLSGTCLVPVWYLSG
jgi:maltodextrin utilization protein YvdJ